MQSGRGDEVQTGPQTPVEYAEKVHADGTVDLVDTEALGGDVGQMPVGYFYSAEFLGTLLVCCCLLVPVGEGFAVAEMMMLGCLSRESDCLCWVDYCLPTRCTFSTESPSDFKDNLIHVQLHNERRNRAFQRHILGPVPPYTVGQSIGFLLFGRLSDIFG